MAPKQGPVVIYGIKNCDTIKKARAWLDAHGVAYEFHDYKAAGVEAYRLAAWAQEVGWETLLNKSGTTFRNLPETARADLTEAKALRLMGEHPSLIRRPVLAAGSRLLVGFGPDLYAAFFR